MRILNLIPPSLVPYTDTLRARTKLSRGSGCQSNFPHVLSLHPPFNHQLVDFRRRQDLLAIKDIGPRFALKLACPTL